MANKRKAFIVVDPETNETLQISRKTAAMISEALKQEARILLNRYDVCGHHAYPNLGTQAMQMFALAGMMMEEA